MAVLALLLGSAAAPRNALGNEIDVTGSWQANLACGGEITATMVLAFVEDTTTGAASAMLTSCPTFYSDGAIHVSATCGTTPSSIDSQVTATSFTVPTTGDYQLDGTLETPFFFSVSGCEFARFFGDFGFATTITDDGAGTATRLVGCLRENGGVLYDSLGAQCGPNFSSPCACTATMLRNDVPVGTDRTVSPIDGTTVTFAEASAPGTVTITPLTTPDGAVPANFQLLGVPTYYDVTTTATVAGTITVCLPYADADDDGFVDGMSPPVSENDLQLLHEEGGVFVDRTVSRDTAANRVCGETSSLSQFALGAPRAAAASLGPWMLGPSTNGAWANNGVAGVPGHLYTVTGLDAPGGAEVAAIQADGSLAAWAPTSSPNLARVAAITLAAGSVLYIVGGHTGTDPAAATATVELAPIQADGSLGPWTYISSMNVARTNHAGALGAGRIYMLGNYGGSNTVESAAILADGTLGPWRAESSMNQSRGRPAAAVVPSFLYAIGGLPFTTTVERAPIGTDGVLGTWEYVASTQMARYELGAASIGSLLFAVGGYNDTDGGFASVEVSDFTGAGFGSWSFASPLTSPYWNANATAVGSVLYAVGSREKYSGASDNSVEFAALVPTTTMTSTTSTSTTTTTSTTLPAQTVLGKSFLVRDPQPGVDPSLRSVVVLGKEPLSDNTVVGTPITNGATIEIIANGASSTGQVFTLPPGAAVPHSPAPGWKAIGNPVIGYVYNDSLGVNGPVKSAYVKKVTKGTIFYVKATIRGSLGPGPQPHINVLPPAPGTDGGMRFTITAGDTYCVAFGGAAGGKVTNSPTRGTPNKTFRIASKSTAPLVESGCPSNL